jgi:TonB family protein
MTNLQLITILKNQLSISIILGLMILTPVKSIGNSNIQSITNNLQPSGASLTIQDTHIQLSVTIPGDADIDTVKNNPDLDTHYPGGKAAWDLFFRKNFKYPEDALKNGINRVVSVRFIISKKGSIKKAEVINGIDRIYDKAVLKVVNMMPEWTPFLKDGVPFEVPLELNIPLYQDSPYKDDEVLNKQIEQQPKYPGEIYAMHKFLRDNMQYPTKAQETGTQGTIYIRFVVRDTGKITDAKVLAGIGNGCDEEALRVVKEMPNWIPGRDNGKAVSVYYTIPIEFKLTMNSPNTPKD